MFAEKLFRAYLDFVSEKYQHEHEETRIHVHDLVRCKHKSYMETIFPEFASVASPVLFIGEAVDEFTKLLVTRFKEIFPNLESTEKEIEKTVEYDDKIITIVGRPDILLKDAVIEIKYSRLVNEEPLEHHLNQLKLYIFLTGKPRGYLIYFMPTGIREFIVEEEITEDFVKSLIDSWKSPRYEWECQYCNYRYICPHRVIPSNQDKSSES